MNLDRAAGVLLGLACGDALGRAVEFKSAAQIAATHGTLRSMVGDGTWGQPAGTITDDTEQALCLARSLVDRGRFDPAEVADRFVEWYETNPFDIGIMTQKSIARLQSGIPWGEAGQQVWESSPEGSNAGNGSVMRCPPLAIAYVDDPEILVRVSRESSMITHADPRCTYGSAVLNLTIANILLEESVPLAVALEHLGDNLPVELRQASEPIVEGADLEPLPTSGYVVDTLQTGLHDALSADSLEDAIVTTVNRGGDTDTIGAVCGAVAGARFGASDLPDVWLAEIEEEDELRELAGQLASDRFRA